MPFRSSATLQSWVNEFEQQRPGALTAVRVIPQDGSEGADTGLIGVRLPDSPVEIYVEPPSPSTGTEWTVTFERREEPVTLGPRAISRIAEEMTALVALCTFLQEKSDRFLAEYRE